MSANANGQVVVILVSIHQTKPILNLGKRLTKVMHIRVLFGQNWVTNNLVIVIIKEDRHRNGQAKHYKALQTFVAKALITSRKANYMYSCNDHNLKNGSNFKVSRTRTL